MATTCDLDNPECMDTLILTNYSLQMPCIIVTSIYMFDRPPQISFAPPMLRDGGPDNELPDSLFLTLNWDILLCTLV